MAATQAPQLEVADARSIASKVAEVHGVAALHHGRFGEVALLYPGERVSGLRRVSRAGELHIEIHVIADFSAGVNLYDLASDIRDVAQKACSIEIGRVDVIFSDATDSSTSNQ